VQCMMTTGYYKLCCHTLLLFRLSVLPLDLILQSSHKGRQSHVFSSCKFHARCRNKPNEKENEVEGNCAIKRKNLMKFSIKSHAAIKFIRITCMQNNFSCQFNTVNHSCWQMQTVGRYILINHKTYQWQKNLLFTRNLSHHSLVRFNRFVSTAKEMNDKNRKEQLLLLVLL
jgi:hypothetical protein